MDQFQTGGWLSFRAAASVCNAGTNCDAGLAGADAGATECAAGCEAWQTCQPGDGGTCRNVTVTITSPADMTEFSGTAAVRVTARVTQWDGGGFVAASIPASAQSGTANAPGAGLLHVDGGVYEGVFQLLNVAGPVRLTAGWPAVADNVTILSQVCSLTCSGWEQCLPTQDGGVCQNLGLSMMWLSPSVNQRYGSGDDAQVRVVFSTADGGAFAGVVPANMSGDGSRDSTVMLNGSTWDGVLGVGAAGGTKTITVGWFDGGPTFTRDVFVDVVPPQLGLVVDAGVFRRDAIATAVLTADEPLADAGLSLGGVVMRRLADTACPNFGSVSNAAACFELDFSKPALNALNGNFSAVASAEDMYRNKNGAADGGAPSVTRVRWDIPATAFGVQTLAIGHNGAVYVAAGGSSGGELVAVTPEGDAGTRNAIGDVRSVAVGIPDAGAFVYIAYNTATTGSIAALNGDTLTSTGLRSACEGANNSKTYSGLALYRPANEVLALGSVNSYLTFDGTGCLYRPSSGVAYAFGASSTLNAAAPSGGTTSNVLITGSSASFIRQDGTGAWWQPVALNGQAAPSVSSAAATQIGIGGTITSFGQALLGTQFLIAMPSIGGVGNQLFLRPSGTDGNLGSATVDKGIPAFASATEGYLGQGDALVRFNPSNLASSATSLTTVPSDSIRTSPVLGAPRNAGSPGEGYAVSANGELVVFSLGSGLAQWKSTVAPGVSVVTHPAFDCNRSRPESKTGILYVGTQTGRVISIIVDSPKLLDSTGAWPKYQRTMGNAGNDDLANFPTNWDACNN